MKVYIVYVSSDYSTAVFMSTDKNKAEKEMEKLKNKGIKTYIENYDFSVSKSFELDCG